MTARIATVVLVVCCTAPARFHAPAGWYVNGVRPSGAFDLRPVLGDPARDLDDARGRVNLHDDRHVVGWLYCTGGSTPRQDDASVWCQR